MIGLKMLQVLVGWLIIGEQVIQPILLLYYVRVRDVTVTGLQLFVYLPNSEVSGLHAIFPFQNSFIHNNNNGGPVALILYIY